MPDNTTLSSIIAALEGQDRLLFSTPDNPYESIYIRAKVEGGALTVTDSECEHGPDGGWSHRVLRFDEENTRKVFLFLLERNRDPLRALSSMLNYTDRTSPFRKACDERGIQFKSYFSF